MITKSKTKHTKHTKLTKPRGGQYHSNEWGIIGAPCDIIKELALSINDRLKKTMTIGFLDADHKKARKTHKFHTSYVDKISYQNLQTDSPLAVLQSRHNFIDLDLLLVNGNHYTAAKQIVLINEAKKESLQRKIDRLTDIRIILLERSTDDIYDFVLELVKDKSNIQVFKRNEIEKISQAIIDDYDNTTNVVYGLILAGGKSKRMGQDKGSIEYYDQPHRDYLAKLVKPFCHQVFISCRKNQDELIETKNTKLYDTFEGLGPYGAILSAFRSDPNKAWLVLACDLPFMDNALLKQLFKARNRSKMATCFYNSETDFPEPLITIWEPRSYPVMLEYLSQGYSCPRKVLINTDIEMIKLADESKLTNANDLEAMKKAKNKITANL